MTVAAVYWWKQPDIEATPSLVHWRVYDLTAIIAFAATLLSHADKQRLLAAL